MSLERLFNTFVYLPRVKLGPLLVLLCSILVLGQCQAGTPIVVEEKSILEEIVNVNGIIQIDNGHAILCTKNAPQADNYRNSVVLFVDGDFKTVWKSEFTGVPKTFIHTSDNGYLIGGSDDIRLHDSSIILTKLTNDGDISWNKTYGGNDHESGAWIVERSNGYFVSGITESYGKGGHDIWWVRINQTGIEFSNETHGTDNSDYPSSLYETPDGGFLGLETYGRIPRIVVVKVDSDGNVEWKNKLGDTKYDQAGFAISINETEYVLNHRIKGNSRPWITCLDTEGIVLWNRTIKERVYRGCNALSDPNVSVFIQSGKLHYHSHTEHHSIIWNETIKGAIDPPKYTVHGLVIQTPNLNGYHYFSFNETSLFRYKSNSRQTPQRI